MTNPAFLAAYASLAIMLVYLVILRPKWLLWILVMSYPIELASALGSEGSTLIMTPAKGLGFLALLGVFIDSVKTGRPIRFSEPVSNLVIAVLLGFSISAAVNESQIGKWAWRFVSGAVFFIVVHYWVRSYKDLDKLRWSMIGSLVSAFVLWAISSAIGYKELPDLLSDRFTASFADPNQASEYMLLSAGAGMATAMGSLHKGQLAKSLFFFAASVASCFLILTTGSRAGFLGIIMFAVMVLVLVVRKVRHRGAVVLVAVAATLALSGSVPEVFKTRVQEEMLGPDAVSPTQIDTLAMRLQQIDLGFKWFTESPWLGIGPEQILDRMRREHNLRHVIHNRPMEVAVSAGVVGLVPYVMLLAWSAWCFIYAIRRLDGDLKLVATVDLCLFLSQIIFGLSLAGAMDKTVFYMLSFAMMHYRLASIGAATEGASGPSPPDQKPSASR